MTTFAIFIMWFGRALFVLAAILALVALVDWLVRTRRINPFNPVARFFRRAVDPLIAPVERRVVRAGGMPHAAPWWALVFVVVAGIVLLGVMRWTHAQLSMARGLGSQGAWGIAIVLIDWTFRFLQFALLVRVISSWLRVSPYSRWVWWSYRLTEPLLAPLRSVIPPIGGMIDVTPIVAYFILWLLRMFVLGALASVAR